ncbi:MAG: hypothetical protein JXA25_17950 [Anaerolineales bacterium]|nr:hypothetical protein [Anaerolineales bacterium]
MKPSRIMSLALLLMVFFFTPAFQLRQDSKQIYYEDFEGFNRENQLERVFAVWEDGAVMEVSIAGLEPVQDNQSLFVRILSPHPQTGVLNGSFYHVLAGSDRDWRTASSIQFRVANPEEDSLSLSFNFKEEYNEYWAVGESGVYYLEQAEGALLQREIWYGNLLIPGRFDGIVQVPMYYFVVPEWNTARGDEVLDLSRIESYAFGVNASSEVRRSFYLDDIQVLSGTEFARLDIHGAADIQAPFSGEHREQFVALLGDLAQGSVEPVAAAWEILESPDPAIHVDQEGWLMLPAGVQGGELTLQASWQKNDMVLANTYRVVIHSTISPVDRSSDSESAAHTETEEISSDVDEDYEAFSREFEVWARENRSQYVFLAVGAVLIVLFLLSVLQGKVK